MVEISLINFVKKNSSDGTEEQFGGREAKGGIDADGRVNGVGCLLHLF